MTAQNNAVDRQMAVWMGSTVLALNDASWTIDRVLGRATDMLKQADVFLDTVRSDSWGVSYD
eukprot:12717543-Alexandrium_andersonii.AAC.1